MRNYSLLLKLTLIVGIIGLLNFVNLDLGSASEKNLPLINSSKSNQDYSIKKTNLTASDADFNEIPYFQSETIPAGGTTTVNISNHWSDSITAKIQLASDGSDLTTTVISTHSAATLTITPDNPVDLTVSASGKDGFRGWEDESGPFIQAVGDSTSEFDSFTHIPDIRYFTTDSSGTRAGDYFFQYFLYGSELTSLPEGSFNISTITEVGDFFFYGFTAASSLTQLPAGSFNTSNITSIGDYFFSGFVHSSALTSLPAGSFNISRITNAHNDFFSYFCYNTSITTLPIGSFNTSNISSVGDYFFYAFGYMNSLTSLPKGSFNTSKITQTGSYFFANFANTSTLLSSLPEGSFNTSKITSAGDFFFNNFAEFSALTSLPEGSFNTSKIATAGRYFFNSFNYYGSITSLPVGSFNFDALQSTGYGAFVYFNDHGLLSSLPHNSFNTKNTAICVYDYDDFCFSFFNDGGLLSKSDSGVSIKNISDQTQTFYWATGSTADTGSQEVASGSTFCCYLSDSAPTPTHTFTDISKLSAYRQAAINWLYDQGITSGCNTAQTKYCPQDSINRGSMAVFLQLLSGQPSGSSKTSSFADVFANDSKTITYVSDSKTSKQKVSALSTKRIAAINWLAQNGLTGGSGSAKVNGKIVSTYRPQDVVNRGSMATFILKFAKKYLQINNVPSQTSSFADVFAGNNNKTLTYLSNSKNKKELVEPLSSARVGAINWLYATKITGGSSSIKSGSKTLLAFRPQDSVNRGSMAVFLKKLYEYIN